MKLSENFDLKELTVTNSGLPNIPGNFEIENLKQLCKYILQPLRNYFGVPVIISSGYRSPEVNQKIGGALNSQHLLGQAVDITVKGRTNEEITRAIKYLNLPFDQLINEEKNGAKWVHVSYSTKNRREELTFKDGVYKVVSSVPLISFCIAKTCIEIF